MPRDLRARLRALLPFVRRRSHEAVLADWRSLRSELRVATAEARAARDALRRVQRSVRFSEAAEETWEALLREASAYHPVRDETALFYQPSENPYLRLLYGGCPEVGIRPRPIPTLKRLEQLEVEGIVHLHWASFLQPPGRDAAHVRGANRAFLAALDAKRRAGLRFLWTIHEPLPHDCRLPEEEIQLRGELARRADAIHVLHASTLDEIGGLYPVPRERVFEVPHPLFTGFYPDHVPRGAARAMLGIGEDEIVLLGFGALRPYKGFDRLVPVADHLEARLGRPVRILLAGPVFRSWGVSELEDLGDLDPRVLLLKGSVPDEHVQVLFRAADLAVLPYRHMLNSSVLMLSLTFGLRAVSPDVPPARDVLDSGLVHLFPMDDDGALAETVEKAVGLGRGGPLAPELVRRFDAAEAARAFACQVAERVLGREAPADAALSPRAS